MQIISYVVSVRFARDLRHTVEHREWILQDAKKADGEFYRSLDLQLCWITGKHGDFRKAA